MHAAAVRGRTATVSASFLRRSLALFAFAAALLAGALGATIATSGEARAEWYGKCDPGGGLNFNCPSVEEACRTLAQNYGEILLGISMTSPGSADCRVTPMVGGGTIVRTEVDCPLRRFAIDPGWGPGCNLAPPFPGEGLGNCPTCGGTSSPTGPGSPGGPVGGDGTGSGGNPLTVDNGNKFEAVTDYRSSGPDVLEFTRYYNALSGDRVHMGLRWRHNFSASLELRSGTVTLAHRQDGRIEEFTSATGSDPWTSTVGGVVGRLSKTADGWTYTRPDDTEETYDPAGRLLAITKKNGYTQTIDYALGGVPGVWAINDSHGRTLTLDYTWYAPAMGWRLTRLVDPDGRVYTYNYRSITAYNIEPWILDEVVYPDDTPDPPESDGVSLLVHFDGPEWARTAPDASLDSHLLHFVYPAALRGGGPAGGGGIVQIEQQLFNQGYIWVPDSDEWHFGAGEFTAEGWINFANIGGYRSLYRQWGGTGQRSWALDYDGSAKQLRFVYSTDGTVTAGVVNAPFNPASNVWYHVAVDRDSAGTLRLYVNGNVGASAAVPAAIFDAPMPLEIGRWVHGWVDEARIDKGRARYAGPFTPPTAAYPDLRQDNPRVTYQFEDPVFLAGLTGVTDETGQRTATWSYDGVGRATLSRHGGGADEVTVTWNADGTTTLRNALGKDFTYDFANILGRLRVTRIDRLASLDSPAAAMTFGYDANGYVNQVTDWSGNVTTYEHDARGLQTSRIEGFGTPEARTTTTEWDPAYRVPTTIAAPERTTTMTYYPNGLLHTRTVTDTTTHTVPYSTNGQSRTWTYTYNARGLVETVDGPLPGAGDVTTYAWDPVTGNLTGVTNALGHATRITAYDASGRPLTTLDANGVETTLAYDVRGRLIGRTVDSGAGGTPAVTQFAYDLAGQLTGMTLPDGSTLSYEYDQADRLIAIVNGLGERIEYGYDAMGNRTSQTVKAADATIVRTASAAFDDLGRMLKSLGAYPGEETAYAYDANGNTVSVTDPLGNVTQSAFDALDRVIQVTDPAVGGVSGVAEYGYDAAGNRETATDPRGLTTAYVHNGFGEAIQQSSPDTGVTVYEYDAAGNRTRRTDARGVVTEWSYDALGRVAAMTFPASPAENVTYAYDDPTPGNYGTGRLASVTDDSGSTSYRYDARGNTVRVESVIETPPLAAQTYVTQYSYDLADRLVQMVYPVGAIVDYARDSIGRVSGMTARANAAATPVAIAAAVTWQPFGPLAGLVHENGAALARSFDLDGRIASIVTDSPDPLAPRLQDLAYSYDLAGNVTGIADAADAARSQGFGYDALHRLTAATGAYGALGYAYDAVGNRTERTADAAVTTYGYDALSNRLDTVTSPAGTRVRDYSASGATVSQADGATGTVLQTATYDASDRLVQVANAAGPLGRYLHNALGQRVAKRVDGVTTHYLYDLSGNLIAEHGGDGAWQRIYFRLDGMLLGGARRGGPRIGAIHVDHLGTPQKVTDETAAVVWDAVYRPFGATESIAGPLTFNLRFPGQYFDAETGLHYNYFRTYDPGTGRYLESDPIGLAGGWNTYAYVGGNPVMRVDPRGQTQEQIDDMNLLAIALNPDLPIEFKVCVEDLQSLRGDTRTGEMRRRGTFGGTDATTRICIDAVYLKELTCYQMPSLYRVIVHEGIHARNWKLGIPEPEPHTIWDEIATEATTRMEQARPYIEQMYPCPGAECQDVPAL